MYLAVMATSNLLHIIPIGCVGQFVWSYVSSAAADSIAVATADFVAAAVVPSMSYNKSHRKGTHLSCCTSVCCL